MPGSVPGAVPGAVTRRFYWELAGAGHGHGATALQLLSDPRLDAALRLLRAIRPAEPLRIACGMALDDKVDLAPILRARVALARHEIALDLWPQLRDDDTAAYGARFLNTSSAATYQARLLPLLDELERSSVGEDIGLALDLEPNEELVRAAWSLRDPAVSLWARARAAAGVVQGLGRAVADARQGRRDLTELARDLEAREIPVHVAVLPPLGRASAPAAGSDLWRTWALGCPVVDVDGAPLFGLQAALCYAPLAKSLPLQKEWNRAQEKQTLALWAARHRAHFDAIVIGQTAPGLFGDAAVYEDAALFAEDVRAMDALGFTDVAIYSLEGLLFGSAGGPPADLCLRPDAERWIAAAFGDHAST